VIVVPATVLLIAVLVYGAVGEAVDLGIVLGSIPYACSGGVLALFLSHTTFSVSASMGFVSVFGIAVQDSIIIVSSLKQLRSLRAESLESDVLSALDKRLRPALMTTLVALLGLLPAAMSTGPGSQAQRPLAIVVIGGSLILAFLSPLVKPAILLIAYRWKEREGSGATALVPDPFQHGGPAE
jgi:cobalt-zinc-cadmium resistance protein CzcA